MTMLSCSVRAPLLCAIAVLSLSACNSLPYYHPGAGDATVTYVGLGTPSICTKGVSYRLDLTHKDGYSTAKVPAGERITVWNSMAFANALVVSRCAPKLAFTPAAGTNYIVNAGVSYGECFIEVVREDRNRDTGVAVEPSTAPPEC